MEGILKDINLEISEKIGTGSFASVYKGTIKGNGEEKEVAIKLVRIMFETNVAKII